MKAVLIKTHATKAITSAESDLLARVGIALVLQQRAGWHEINVAVASGLVTLGGRVSSFYNRQLVVAVTKRVAGVRHVSDELIVDERPFVAKRVPLEVALAGVPESLETTFAIASVG